MLDSVRKRIKRVRRLLDREKDKVASYAEDPVGYARDVLKARLYAKQEEIGRLALIPPYKVLVKSGNKVGKTFTAGWLTNWWYDTFDPGLVLTTAPTDRQVRDLLWKEVRKQRRSRGGFRGPKMPRLESAPDHFAHGFTARDADAFQGHHGPHTLLIFDEATGVKPEFWEAAEAMFSGVGHAWICFFNPTDSASQVGAECRKQFEEDGTKRWHEVTLSTIEHPNIVAELRGERPPYPSAMRLARFERLLRQWSSPLAPGESPKAGDVEWPPGSGKWLRPGPVAEARLLGRWPTQAINSVWSEADWSLTERTILLQPTKALPEIGCDVARFGDDFTEFHVRWGGLSLHHEAHNGWNSKQVNARLKELATEWARIAGCHRSKILCKIDSGGGYASGVLDYCEDYAFLPINAGSEARDPESFPNKRSELWFAVADLARAGKISTARLPPAIRDELRKQALAPTYTIDWAGRKVVEPKDKTKEKLGRSPDGMDAMNLAYCFAQPPFERVAGRVN